MGNISQDVALRIALAARALPDTEVKALLLGLITLLGEPLTTAKLNKTRLNKLKQIDNLAEVDEQYLKQALDYLRGRGINTEPDPLPEVEPYADGDMPASLRVACASNPGEQIDGHFGSCSRFLIYQVGTKEVRLVDIRVPGPVPPDEDKNALRAQLVSDCDVLYTVSVGGPAAAKVVRMGLHPIKVPQGGSAGESLDRLKKTLAGSPPPWLAKVMGENPEERVRFQRESEEQTIQKAGARA